MNWCKQRTLPLTLARDDFQHATSILSRDPGEFAIVHARIHGIARMNFDEGLGKMQGEARTSAGSRHAVPLIADTARVEPIGKLARSRALQRRMVRRNELSFAVGGEKSAIGEKALLLARFFCPRGPLRRCQALILIRGNIREPGNIKTTRAVILESGQRGVLAENVHGRAIRKFT